MKPADLVSLLQECYRERLALVERHKAVATHVLEYNANNTYQYVINREETHLTWLADALSALGATVPADVAGPSVTIGRGKDAWRALADEDATGIQAFLARWQPRVESLSQARDQTMLRLMLGEVKEQLRFFQQVGSAQPELLGRSDTGAGERGVVGPNRWIGQ